jgi:Tfp pilus assembly protein PilE
MHHKLNKQQSNTKNQKGMTFIGVVIMVALVLFVAIIAMRMMPSYIEFMAVKKVLHAMGEEQLSTMSKKEIIESFSRRKSIDDIHSVTLDDLVIEKSASGSTVVSVDYQVVKPIMGNVSVVIDFKASSDSK